MGIYLGVPAPIPVDDEGKDMETHGMGKGDDK